MGGTAVLDPGLGRLGVMVGQFGVLGAGRVFPCFAALSWWGIGSWGFAELSVGVGCEDGNKRGCKSRDTITQEGF